jgi:hypothetical protein
MTPQNRAQKSADLVGRICNQNFGDLVNFSYNIINPFSFKNNGVIQ